MSASVHAEKLLKKFNAKGFSGLSLRNASGDINQSSVGFQIAIDTLTYIKKQVTEQKFYEVAPADYVPIAIGEGAFSQNILTNLTVNAAGGFEEGVINTGTGNDRIATADSGIVSKTMKIVNWAKAIGYSIIEIEQALMANNWDVIEQKHRARKKNWDLGIQETAFLGSKSDSNVKGLFTSTDINSDTATITKTISSMSAAEFATFVSAVIGAYQANCAYTAFPDTFVIPQDDWTGLATPVSSTYPNVSKLEYLQRAFDAVVPNKVKLMPSVYGLPSINATRGLNGGSGFHRYVMYRKDPESIRMDIPVDLTITQPNTVNNFQFQDVGYGQFTGVGIYRGLEALYFDF